MTTAQNMLHEVYYKQGEIIKLLYNDKGDILSEMQKIVKDNEELIKRIDNVEEQLSLIIKLLNKNV